MDDDDSALGAFADASAAHAAQVAKGLRPARAGRPRGSTNRKTAEFETWYRESGRRDPLMVMADFITTDLVELQAWFAHHEMTIEGGKGKKAKGYQRPPPTLFALHQAQMAAAGELAPYLHGKQPIRVKVEDERLPMLVLNLGTNQLDQAKVIEGRRVFSAGSPVDVSMNEIKGLAEDESEVRNDDDANGG